MFKEKIKKKEIKYFSIPMVIVSILFLVFTYALVNSQIQTQFRHLEDLSIKLTNSYAHLIDEQKEASSLVTEMYNEKLIVAMNAILMFEHHWSQDTLNELGDKFDLDALYVYSSDGEIILSMNNEYLGWAANEGHPVYKFMQSNEKSLVEEIRKDTESDEYFKYGYLKLNDSSNFIQVGISAEKIYNMLDKFSVDTSLYEIKNESDVSAIAFININKSIQVSSNSEDVNLNSLKLANLSTSKPDNVDIVRENGMFRIVVAINHNGLHLGWLAMYWPTNETDNEVLSIIVSGIFLYLIVTIVFCFILYYAYKKDRSNYQLAYYDSLTKLPNRSFLREYLNSVYSSQSKKYSAFIAVSFKNIQSIVATYGYLFADEVIRQLTKTLLNLIEQNDELYRFSSDRFVILIKDDKSSKYQLDLCSSIIEQFKLPIYCESAQQYVNVEVGLVELDGRHKEADQIFQEASITISYLHEMKSAFGLYNEQMEAFVKNDDFIEHIIRSIIHNEDKALMELVYQPIVDVHTQNVVSFEALLRVTTSTGLTISPQVIISIAEKRQLIYELGNKIISEVCYFIKEMNSLGIDNIRVAVNISGLQILREEFIESVKYMVRLSKINFYNLEFEITESILLDNLEIVNVKMNQLKKLGITISLDDFGTGYSSLARLRDLNINVVKIDKYFIDRIETLEFDNLISGDIISMVHKIGLFVIAEGVETEKQLNYLKDTNCDFIQGYYISRPLSKKDAIKFLLKK